MSGLVEGTKVLLGAQYLKASEPLVGQKPKGKSHIELERWVARARRGSDYCCACDVERDR